MNSSDTASGKERVGDFIAEMAYVDYENTKGLDRTKRS